MNFPFYIARRYLFSKKSHNAINVISLISVCGVVVATIALVCALSVYNGFNDLVSSLFSHFDPELKITAKYGKVFDPECPEIRQIKELPDIAVSSATLQDNALIRYKSRQEIGVVKGVDGNFSQLVDIDSVLIDGKFVLSDEIANYATLGIGLASHLGINSSFNLEYTFITAVFRINQQVYDDYYMIVPLQTARKLLNYDQEVSSLELRLKEGAALSSVEKKIKKIAGDKFEVKNRYEQQEASFKMMQVEKWVTFLILCFVLAIALFNIVGSLSMLMIEKKEDVKTLRNMGANESQIRRIFLFEGWMISGFGAVIGIIGGIVLCLLQQEFGLIQLGDAGSNFIIDAYPVHILFSDVLAVFITVVTIGFLAAWYPVRYLGKKWLSSGENPS